MRKCGAKRRGNVIDIEPYRRARQETVPAPHVMAFHGAVCANIGDSEFWYSPSEAREFARKLRAMAKTLRRMAKLASELPPEPDDAS